ncbi:MAG: hypothetical protein AAGA48_35200 [Myxococcota bacterium]
MVEGNLSIITKEKVSLPKLREIRGSLIIGRGSPPSVSLPALTTITEGLSVYQSALASFDAGKLRNVGTDLGVERNEHLTDLNLPSLETTGLWLSVRSNPKLRQFKLPKLRVVGGRFQVFDNPSAETYSFPELYLVKMPFTMDAIQCDDPLITRLAEANPSLDITVSGGNCGSMP